MAMSGYPCQLLDCSILRLLIIFFKKMYFHGVGIFVASLKWIVLYISLFSDFVISKFEQANVVDMNSNSHSRIFSIQGWKSSKLSTKIDLVGASCTSTSACAIVGTNNGVLLNFLLILMFYGNTFP